MLDGLLLKCFPQIRMGKRGFSRDFQRMYEHCSRTPFCKRAI